MPDHLWWSLLVPIFAVACIGAKVETGPVDLDADGALAEDDCDDQDDTLFPGATEICDGIDNDCDGLVDAYAIDQGRFYVDADADGYGEPSYEVASCETPAGYSPSGGDCDDNDAAVFPGAVEVCDGVDNDCDGLSDDDDPEVDKTDATRWHRDADADGYGDEDDRGEKRCEDPSDAFVTYAAEDSDCDDDSAAVHPGASEICGDAQDNDCDGTDNGCTALGEVALAEVDEALLLSAAGDAAGTAVAGAGDNDGDGLGDLLVGAPEGEQAVYLVSGPVRGTLGLDAADAVLVGPGAADAFGLALWADDLNADGYGDVVVGAPGAAGDGVARVFLGPLRGSIPAGAADAAWRGESYGASSTATAGFGGVGAVFGAPAYAVDDVVVGAAWWVADATVGGGAADALGAVEGEVGWEGLGGAVAGPGDVDGDGLEDLLLGLPAAGEGAGAAALVLGPAEGLSVASDADGLWVGTEPGAGLGSAVAGAGGSIDGDGYADLVLGAPNATGEGDGGGEVWVVAGATVEGGVGTVVATLVGPPGSGAGASVASGADVDGDGSIDLLVGGPFFLDSAGEESGAAWLIFGPVSGTVALSSATRTLVGAGGERAGAAVALVRDTDGDEHADLLIGAPYFTADEASAGAAWLVSGVGW